MSKIKWNKVIAVNVNCCFLDAQCILQVNSVNKYMMPLGVPCSECGGFKGGHVRVTASRCNLWQMWDVRCEICQSSCMCECVSLTWKLLWLTIVCIPIWVLIPSLWLLPWESPPSRGLGPSTWSALLAQFHYVLPRSCELSVLMNQSPPVFWSSILTCHLQEA